MKMAQHEIDALPWRVKLQMFNDHGTYVPRSVDIVSKLGVDAFIAASAVATYSVGLRQELVAVCSGLLVAGAGLGAVARKLYDDVVSPDGDHWVPDSVQQGIGVGIIYSGIGMAIGGGLRLMHDVGVEFAPKAEPVWQYLAQLF